MTHRCMHVKGRFLYDGNDEQVVIRGVENFFDADLHGDGDIIPEIAKTGANCLRILFRWNPVGGPQAHSLADLKRLIDLTLRYGMIPHICLVCGDDNLHVEDRLRSYADSRMKALLMSYEEWILLDAVAETTEDSDAAWAANCKKAISVFRDSGYRAPLYLISRTYGRNLPCILNQAKGVLGHDPLGNCVFGWQAYWGRNEYYQQLYGMSLRDAVRRLKDVEYMVQLGILHFADHFRKPDGTKLIDVMDYPLVMKEAAESQLSWLWWDWHYTKDRETAPQHVHNLTRDGIFGHWQEPFGAEVCVDSPYGLRSAVRTRAFKAR